MAIAGHDEIGAGLLGALEDTVVGGITRDIEVRNRFHHLADAADRRPALRPLPAGPLFFPYDAFRNSSNPNTFGPALKKIRFFWT
jgi:hypothetical protein